MLLYGYTVVVAEEWSCLKIPFRSQLINYRKKYHACIIIKASYEGIFSIQFNSKTFFNDGDPISSQLIFPGAIQTCDQTKQHFFIHIYKNITVSSDKLENKQKETKTSINTYTVYIQTCTIIILLSLMNKKIQS